MPKLEFTAVPGSADLAAPTANGSIYQIATGETQPWMDQPEFWLTEFVVFGPEGCVRLDEQPDEDDLPLARTYSLDVAKAICQAHYDAGMPDIDPCPVYRPEPAKPEKVDPADPVVGEISIEDVLDHSETLGSLVVRLNAFIDAGVSLETKVILGTDPATADADTGSNALRYVEQGHYYEQDFIILGDVSENA